MTPPLLQASTRTEICTVSKRFRLARQSGFVQYPQMEQTVSISSGLISHMMTSPALARQPNPHAAANPKHVPALEQASQSETSALTNESMSDY
jgi:hypothetical protein